VRHDEDATDAEQINGEDERSQNVVGDASTSIAQDLGVAWPNPECAEGVDAGVHTRDDRKALGGARG
jgi:hypothetical protein